MNHRHIIYEEVETERLRQNRLKMEGRFDFTVADPEVSDFTALAVLTEEIGETARAVMGRYSFVRDDGDLRTELIQVCAVAVAWIEKLDQVK